MAPQFGRIVLDVPDKADGRTVTVYNKSGSPSAYYLVQVGSDFKNEIENRNGAVEHDSLDKAVRCVYQATKLVNPGMGKWTFTIENKFYAVCGSGQGKLAEGKLLTANDARDVELATISKAGTRLTMTMPDGEVACFEDQDAGESDGSATSVGTFGVRVDHSFSIPTSEYPFLGYGTLNANDPNDVVPLTVWNAQPGGFYTMRCERIWKIVLGSKRAREVIDFIAPLNGVIVDFENEGKGYKGATVIHDSGGIFTVTYS